MLEAKDTVMGKEQIDTSLREGMQEWISHSSAKPTPQEMVRYGANKVAQDQAKITWPIAFKAGEQSALVGQAKAVMDAQEYGEMKGK